MIAAIALLAAAAGASTSPPSYAPAVTVQIAGERPADVRAALRSAAQTVCRAPQNADIDDTQACVDATYSAALSKAAPMMRLARTRIRTASIGR